MNTNIKTLGFVVPCYGKTNDIVERTLESIKKSLLICEDIDVVFVYKNTDKFNYDWVKEKYPMIRTICSKDSSIKRTNKIKLGLEAINAKYWYPLDADDEINYLVLNDFIKQLKDLDSDLIVMDYIRTNDKNNEFELIEFTKTFKKKNGASLLSNYVVVYKLETFKKILDTYNLDSEVHFNDIYMVMAFLKKTESISLISIPLIRYLKYSGGATNLKNFHNLAFVSFVRTMLEQHSTPSQLSKEATRSYKKNLFLIIFGYWSGATMNKVRPDKKFIKSMLKVNEILFLSKVQIRFCMMLGFVGRWLTGTSMRLFAKWGVF